MTGNLLGEKFDKYVFDQINQNDHRKKLYVMITGGFNFQNAWTGGFLAAREITSNL